MDLFQTTGAFVTRDQCGPGWTPTLMALYVAFNSTVAVAYYSMPVALIWLYRKRRHVLPHPHMLVCFGAFIAFCGGTHLMNVLAFWWPAYRAFTLLDGLTAFVSFATAIMLPATVRYVARLPSPEEYARALAEKDAAADRERIANSALALRLEREVGRALILQATLDRAEAAVADLEAKTKAHDEIAHLRWQLRGIALAAK